MTKYNQVQVRYKLLGCAVIDIEKTENVFMCVWLKHWELLQPNLTINDMLSYSFEISPPIFHNKFR